MSGNNLTDFLRRYDYYMNKAYRYPKLNDLRTYGEEYRSNYFIRLGYENIRTLENFNKYFKRIFYEDKRNYKCSR